MPIAVTNYTVESVVYRFHLRDSFVESQSEVSKAVPLAAAWAGESEVSTLWKTSE